MTINLLPERQNTPPQLIVITKPSVTAALLSALSPNRGLDLTNASTEAGLRAQGKLGGQGQRHIGFLPLPPSFKGIKRETRIINTMCPEEPAAPKVVWSSNTQRDFQTRHLLKTNISQLLNQTLYFVCLSFVCLLQRTLQKPLQSHVLRCIHFKFQVNIFHRSVKLLFTPNTAQINCISFFPLMHFNHIRSILTVKWKPFVMCREARL